MSKIPAPKPERSCSDAMKPRSPCGLVPLESLALATSFTCLSKECALRYLGVDLITQSLTKTEHGRFSQQRELARLLEGFDQEMGFKHGRDLLTGLTGLSRQCLDFLAWVALGAWVRCHAGLLQKPLAQGSPTRGGLGRDQTGLLSSHGRTGRQWALGGRAVSPGGRSHPRGTSEFVPGANV